MNEIVGFTRTPMIRSAVANLVDVVLRPRQGDRRPTNIPIGVDNLWEWARPPGRPSRRRSAFASPSAELARRWGPAGGIACRVLVRSPFLAAQISGCDDARHHADVRTLSDRIETLCRFHPALEPLRTQFLGDPTAVSTLLQPLGEGIAAELMSAVTLWADVIPIKTFTEAGIDTIGEFFFEAPEGYVLEPITR